MADTFLAKGKRKKLIDEIRRKGISDEEVLRAMNAVPRHEFMDPAFLHHAYSDKAFPISSGQTISQPYTVAVQTSLLNVRKRDKILEIGTGSGYQCAILVEMGARVIRLKGTGSCISRLRGHCRLLVILLIFSMATVMKGNRDTGLSTAS